MWMYGQTSLGPMGCGRRPYEGGAALYDRAKAAACWWTVSVAVSELARATCLLRTTNAAIMMCVRLDMQMRLLHV